MATDGTGARAPPATWARAGRSRPPSASRPETTFALADDQRPRRHPADLDDAHRQLALRHPPLLLGRRDRALGRVPGRRLLRLRLGQVRARSPRCPSASTPAAPSTATGRCPSASSCRITLENLADEDMTLYYQINYTLTDVPADAAYFHAQFRRVNPLPYKERLHDPRRRQGPGPVRRHLPGLGRQQHRLVGRGRDQVLPGRRQGVPDHLRHRHRGLLLRLLQLRRTRRHSGYQRVHHALHRPAPGDPPGRALPVAASASACTAGTSRTRSASRRTCKVTIQALGWRVGRPLPAAAGRHRLGRLLVPDRAARHVPEAAGQGRPGDHLT